MRTFKLKQIISAMLVMIATTVASADCLIAVQLCKPLSINKPTNFFDADAKAKQFPNRCLERAREFLTACNSPQQTVSSYFYLNGIATIGVVVNSTSSTLYSAAAGGNMSSLLKATSDY